MPPKTKITKDMVLDAAFEIARNEGAEQINARTIAQKIGCSTQPVMYQFATIEEIKVEVFRKAEQFHTSYFMTTVGEFGNPLLEIGMRYIRFAEQEKHLFRFLFQSDRFGDRNIADWVHSEKIQPVLGMMEEQAGITAEQAAELFISVYAVMHGYASMFANNAMEYEEAFIVKSIQRTFLGIVCSMKMEQRQIGEEKVS